MLYYPDNCLHFILFIRLFTCKSLEWLSIFFLCGHHLFKGPKVIGCATVQAVVAKCVIPSLLPLADKRPGFDFKYDI